MPRLKPSRDLGIVLSVLGAGALGLVLLVRAPGGDESELGDDGRSQLDGSAPIERPPTPECGDGRLDPGEDCDPPGETAPCERLISNASLGSAACTDRCRWALDACLPVAPVCGNAVVEGGELCDDGNTVSGDGCDAACLVEIDGVAVHYDGPAVDLRIERALAGSVCRDDAIRRDARRGPRARVEYRLVICELPDGEPVYSVGRIRAALAEARRALRGAGIDLVEDRLDRLAFDADCRVRFGGSASLLELAAESWSARTLPLFFVRGISGSQVPGMDARGFASFGFGAVLASTEPDVITHELGHVFGLPHTHACAAATGAGDCAGDGICDTAFDPGPAWLPQTCPGRSAEVCSGECGEAVCSGGARPDRGNHMSYYSGCRTGFSPEQLDLTRCVLDHELAWLTATDACGSEVCNGSDDDCDGEIDEDGACRTTCEAYRPLELGRTTGSTIGRGESFGGDLYPEGTADLLFELRPDRAGAYCLELGGFGSTSALGPIVAQRDGCRWDSRVVASNLDPSARRLRTALEVTAGPGAPAWISVDGWGRSPGVDYAIEVRRGACGSGPLEPPRLMQPAPGARLVGGPVALRWEPVVTAEAYELRFGPDSAGLTDAVACTGCDAQIVDAPAVSLSGVARDRRVYWTVRALRGGRSGPFARVRSFTVARGRDEPRLGMPRLRSPRIGARLGTLTETFEWDPVEGAQYYQFRLGLDPGSLTHDACQQCLSLRVPGTSHSPSPRALGPDGEYAWTVRAGRGSELGPFARPRPFTIDDWVCTRVGRLAVPGRQSSVTADDGYDDLVASCGGAAGAEQVWLVVPERSGTLCIDTEGAELDTVLSVRERCENAETELACNDDGFGEPGGASRIEINAFAEQPLFIIVDGYAVEDAGRYWLRVEEGACR